MLCNTLWTVFLAFVAKNVRFFYFLTAVIATFFSQVSPPFVFTELLVKRWVKRFPNIFGRYPMRACECMKKWKSYQSGSCTSLHRCSLMASPLKKASFWIALLVLMATAFMMFAVYYDWVQLHVLIGPYFIHHWLSWTGAVFIAFFTPVYYWMKRRNPERLRTLLAMHVFGNLISFMFISIHFTQQISRPAQFYPDLGTGVVLYAAMLLMTMTGLLLRFQLNQRFNRSWRFIHLSVTVTFYLIILVHVLHGLGLI